MRFAARRSLRPAALVLIQAGVLLLIDVGVTLAWREPVSALLATSEHGQLSLDERVASREAAWFARGAPYRARLRALVAREWRRLNDGAAVGRIELPTIGARHIMVEGTSSSNLRRGPPHYPDTALPGQRGTFPVAGHRSTYGAPSRRLDELDRGERIVAEPPYGRFTYAVERTRIVNPRAVSVTRRIAHQPLILTAGHPLYSASDRIVVFARLVDAEVAG